MGCGGLGGAGGVEALPLPGAAAAGVTLEERPQSVIRCSREGCNKRPGSSRGKPSWLPRVRFPGTAHLCCCERSCAVSRLPEPDRAGKILQRLWGRALRVAVKKFLSTTSAPAAASLNTPSSRTRSAGVRAQPTGETRRPPISHEGQDVTIHRLECHAPALGDIRARCSVAPPSIAWLGVHTCAWHHRNATVRLPPISCLCPVSVLHTRHRGPSRLILLQREVALAVADFPRRMQPEGPLHNTSCLPWRRQDKVPQALSKPQPR